MRLVLFLLACAADGPRSFSDDLNEPPVCEDTSGGDCEPDISTDALASSEQLIDSVRRKGDAGVTVPFLFYAPDHPSAAVILFAGSNGLLKLSEKGVGKAASNFVVRTRRKYADAGFCTALVDAPSDHPKGLGNGYRTGATEAKDIEPVIEYLGQHCPNAPIWLVGTSRGTISAANVSARLGGIAGIISTSSISVDPNGDMATLYDVPLGAISVPVQFMHHQKDGCPASPYDGVQNLMRHFKNAPVKSLSPVSAMIADASGSPCGPISYHGYWQLDVVPAILQFIENPR